MRTAVSSARRRTPRTRGALPAGIFVVTGRRACGSHGRGRRNGLSKASGTLVIDTSFVMRTVDPQREFEPTSSIVAHAVYDTLVTFKGSGTTPVPWLATSFKASNGAPPVHVPAAPGRRLLGRNAADQQTSSSASAG